MQNDELNFCVMLSLQYLPRIAYTHTCISPTKKVGDQMKSHKPIAMTMYSVDDRCKSVQHLTQPWPNFPKSSLEPFLENFVKWRVYCHFCSIMTSLDDSTPFPGPIQTVMQYWHHNKWNVSGLQLLDIIGQNAKLRSGWTDNTMGSFGKSLAGQLIFVTLTQT